MSEKLDRGGILLQKELYFDETKETFRTAYEKLQKEIVKLCEDNWEELYNGKIRPREQIGAGSYHSKKDLQKFCDMVSFTWDDNIAEVKMKYKKLLQLCDI
jgi:methionyl-tRNA formyltransferase